jgi:hypothetical protein
MLRRRNQNDGLGLRDIAIYLGNLYAQIQHPVPKLGAVYLVHQLRKCVLVLQPELLMYCKLFEQAEFSVAHVAIAIGNDGQCSGSCGRLGLFWGVCACMWLFSVKNFVQPRLFPVLIGALPTTVVRVFKIVVLTTLRRGYQRRC